MPDVVITGVKENIARFENVIMKQVYNEAGENSTTTAQVIDEETGSVICECEAGGGGGGESDFSTATLKVRFVNADEGAIPAESVFAINGLPFYVPGEQYNYSTGSVFFVSDAQVAAGEYKEVETKVILYKGTCFCDPMFSSTTVSQAGNPVKVEGDVTIDDYDITITGDCTISVDVVPVK